MKALHVTLKILKMFLLLKVLMKINPTIFSMVISCKIYAVLYRQSYVLTEVKKCPSFMKVTKIFSDKNFDRQGSRFP